MSKMAPPPYREGISSEEGWGARRGPDRTRARPGLRGREDEKRAVAAAEAYGGRAPETRVPTSRTRPRRSGVA